MKKSVKIPLIAVSVLLSLIIASAGIFALLVRRGKLQFHKNDKDIKTESVVNEEDGIIYKNRKYKLDGDVISFLLIGIDKQGVNNDYTIGANGQADTILVCTVNARTKAASIIPVSRETLVDVNQYTTSGDYAGVTKEQICLAYAYGKDVKQCSENVLTSVSRVLYGINISSYITMDMDALEKLSNSVGSVEVEVNEDYYDESTKTNYKKGSVISVKGKRAVNYIHWRTEDVDANNYRMQRQMFFIKSFLNKAGSSVSEDFSKVIFYYNMMKPYVSTNISLSQTTYIATSALKVNLGSSIDFKTIKGDTQMLNGYSAFIPDEESVTDTVIETFYKEIG